jgi:hypothetical protein
VNWHALRFNNQDLLEAAQAARVYADTSGHVTTISIDAYTNRVVVGVLTGTVSAAMSELSAFSDRVAFVVEEMPTPITCSSRSNCTPWRGGIRAEVYSNDGDKNHGTFTLRGVKSSGSCWIVTAGHAGTADGSWTSGFWHNGAAVGT